MLVSDVHCTGTEQNLNLCPFTVRSNHIICGRNSSAGVICSRDFSKYGTYLGMPCTLVRSLKDIILIYTNTDLSKKCVDEKGTLPQNQMRIGKMERYIYSHCRN